jgi:hypothetical protein
VNALVFDHKLVRETAAKIGGEDRRAFRLGAEPSLHARVHGERQQRGKRVVSPAIEEDPLLARRWRSAVSHITHTYGGRPRAEAPQCSAPEHLCRGSPWGAHDDVSIASPRPRAGLLAVAR